MTNCILNQNFFDKNSCSSFVLLKDKGLLLNHLENFILPYESKINIGPKFKYGIEIEFDTKNLNKITRDVMGIYNTDTLKYEKNWYTKYEPTVANGDGGEIVSPISYNKKKDWERLTEICNILKNNNVKITDECAIHVHIDFKKLNFRMEDAIRLAKLWSAYEDVIYRFAIGDFGCLRILSSIYAAPIRNEIVRCNKKGDLSSYFSRETNRDYKGWAIKFNDFIDWLNMYNCELPTIEFRITNSSINSKIIQNIVRFFCQLVNSVLQKDKLVDYYLEKRFNTLVPMNEKTFLRNYPDAYEYMDGDSFDKSLELADIIGMNNLDKLCFLKQCLKPDEIEQIKVEQAEKQQAKLYINKKD